MAAFITFGFPWMIRTPADHREQQITKGEKRAVNCDHARTIRICTEGTWEVFIETDKGLEVAISEPKVNANNKAELERAKKVLVERLHTLGIDL